jgi:hypothetical protein
MVVAPVFAFFCPVIASSLQSLPNLSFHSFAGEFLPLAYCPIIALSLPHHCLNFLIIAIIASSLPSLPHHCNQCNHCQIFHSIHFQGNVSPFHVAPSLPFLPHHCHHCLIITIIAKSDWCQMNFSPFEPTCCMPFLELKFRNNLLY